MALSTRAAYGRELIELAKTNKDFVVVCADGHTCDLQDFEALYPDRGCCVGIAEQNMIDVAAGLASCGNKVYMGTFGVFASMRAVEQFRTFVCYPNLNVTLAGTHAGLQVGPDGATHMALEDMAIMRSLANLTVVQPCDESSCRAIVRWSQNFTGPLYIRLHRNPVLDIHDGSFKFELGKIYTLRNYGNDAAILVTGIMVKKALDAAEELKNLGILVQVLEVPSIKPMNEMAIVELAQTTGALVTVEDHTIIGGLGSAVAEVLAEHCPVRMKRIGVLDSFNQSGDPESLYADNKMQSGDIADAVSDLVKTKNTER